MILNVIPIKYGDCIIIEWKDEKECPHIGILDGGSVDSYKEYIRKQLMSISIPIDFWVISHAHSDHIGGVLKYLKDLKSGFQLPHCNCWITNFDIKDLVFDNISVDGTIATSAIQGDLLISYLSKQKGCSIINEVHTGMFIEFPGIKMTMVTAPRVNKNFEFEDYGIAVSPCVSDYKKTLIDFDVTKFEEDINSTNCSSLSVIVECEGKRFLWLADSVPSLYVPALEYIKNKNKDTLSFDLVSLAHHGSRGNTNIDYLNMIKCNKFLVTANAENNQNLPNKETLARVIMNPHRDLENHVQFIFPMDNKTLRTIFAVDGDDIENKLNFSCNFNCQTLDL